MSNTLSSKIKLSATHRRTVFVIWSILWLTGFLWAVILLNRWYTSADAVRSSFEALLAESHGAFSYITLVAIGSLTGHVVRGFELKRNLWSGIAMITSILVLMVTGWLLYYSGNETLRSASSLIHSVLGVIMVFALLFHIRSGRKSGRR